MSDFYDYFLDANPQQTRTRKRTQQRTMVLKQLKWLSILPWLVAFAHRFVYNESQDIQRTYNDIHTNNDIDKPTTIHQQYDVFTNIDDLDGKRELPLLRPQRALQRYVSWHSNTSLALDYDKNGDFVDSNNNNRSFVVGYYSCPIQAGNRLHDFWNSLIVAIVTNRTLLWKYNDPETCFRAHIGYDTNPCEISNHEQDCSRVLKRASWIPSYDEWATISSASSSSSSSPTSASIRQSQADRYVLPTPEALGARNPDYKVGSQPRGHWLPSKETIDKFGGDMEKVYKTYLPNWDMRYPTLSKSYEHRILQTSREWFLDIQISLEDMRQALEKAGYVNNNVDILEDLYTLGPDFLYGMLFEVTFGYEHPTLRQVLDTASSSESAIPTQQKQQRKGRQATQQNDISETTKLVSFGATKLANVMPDGYGTNPSSTSFGGGQHLMFHGNLEHQQKQQQQQPQQEKSRDTVRTIALHVRHPKTAEQGDEIHIEVEHCIDQVLMNMSLQSVSTQKRAQSITSHHTDNYVNKSESDSSTIHDEVTRSVPCQVYIMTDRTKAVEGLTRLVQDKYGCEAVTANHTSADVMDRAKTLSERQPGTTFKSANVGTDGANMTRRDHGPFAGLPFFIDLALVGQARHAFIGDCSRSSSQLLHEMIVYDSVMEYLHHNDHVTTVQEDSSKDGTDIAHVVTNTEVRSFATQDLDDIRFENTIRQHLQSQLHVCCLDTQPAKRERNAFNRAAKRKARNEAKKEAKAR